MLTTLQIQDAAGNEISLDDTNPANLGAVGSGSSAGWG